MNELPRRLRVVIPILCLLGIALAAGGCGSSGKAETREAPAASTFPSAEGKTIDQVLEDSGAVPAEDVVVSPAAETFTVGVNRYPFGVFALSGRQVDDADVALYFAKSANSAVEGPLPAKVISLETKPAYRAQGSAGDVKTAYVVPEVDFDRSGPWLAIAMLKGPAGLEATRLPSPTVGLHPGIPQVGEKAPVVHTPTPDDVGGDLAKIDTRVPPDQMHADFADVVGRKPVILLFATPALCQSRVCGPVVDIAQQVADEYEGEVEFIHMEIYENNEPPNVRPQLQAYGLETEPWLFAIDENGVVRERIEGAFGVAELEEAVHSVLPG
ncbi:MAG: hypothetical protein R2725_01495 [Solirubrobacterales bacterium]